MPHMSPDLGSGISLDADLDLSIDSTGDLSHDTGASELEKDLAFRFIAEFDQVRGVQNRPQYMKDIELFAARLARNDERVDAVNSVDASPIESDAIEIVMELEVSGEVLETVIEV